MVVHMVGQLLGGPGGEVIWFWEVLGFISLVSSNALANASLPPFRLPTRQASARSAHDLFLFSLLTNTLVDHTLVLLALPQ